MINAQLLQSMVDASNDGIVVAEKEGDDTILIYVNAAFECLTGYSRDEILYQDCRFLQGDDRDQLGRARIRKAMADNDKVIVFGQDVAALGGVFRVTEGILGEFGPKRIFNSPIAEAGIIGTGIGLTMRGYRPVAEIQFDGFVFPAFNQITTQLAKLQNRSEGAMTMPVVIRIPYGGGIGAIEHHSESPEAYFAHTPGLRVISPSNPNDAYWMIQQAIASEDPVLFFEPKRRYWQKGMVDLENPPAGMHEATVLRQGKDVTIAAYGPMVATALQAAGITLDAGYRAVEADVLFERFGQRRYIAAGAAFDHAPLWAVTD